MRLDSTGEIVIFWVIGIALLVCLCGMVYAIIDSFTTEGNAFRANIIEKIHTPQGRGTGEEWEVLFLADNGDSGRVKCTLDQYCKANTGTAISIRERICIISKYKIYKIDG